MGFVLGRVGRIDFRQANLRAGLDCKLLPKVHPKYSIKMPHALDAVSQEVRCRQPGLRLNQDHRERHSNDRGPADNRGEPNDLIQFIAR
jgi:hypothetical protein